MLRTAVLWTFVLFCLAVVGQESVTGVVVDSKTNQPIQGAHVFLVSTSHGTITNEAGVFELTAEENNYELGITHVSYDPLFRNVRLSQLNNMVFKLKLSVLVIDEVEVIAKKSNRRNRYLNRFRRALLGESIFAKNCELKNPEVLLFEPKENGGFGAVTKDLLKITNSDLGYNIFLFLEYFESNALTTSLGTKIFFEELAPQSDDQKRQWQENREKAYRGSKRHFLESLVQDKLKQQGFTLRHARINANEELEIIKSANRRQLIVENGLSKTLTIPETLVINYLGKNAFVHSGDSYGQVSYLIPRSKAIDVSDPLRIHPHQLVERGLWAKSGVANWLPHDFRVDKPDKKQIAYINGFELEPLSIPLDQIKRGGPPRDGIPAISNPEFTNVGKARFMQRDDRILGLDYQGIRRAYPVKILDRHEIVNDRFGDQSIIISYCPLCNSGMVFKGLIEGSNREFGVSGLLYNSDVLMYDQETESLWSQIQGEAISGKSMGQKLEYIPVIHTTWEDWKSMYPESQVLTMSKEYLARYDNPAYQNYHNSDELMFPVTHTDNTLKNKSWIAGISLNGVSKAYPFSYLKKNPSFTDLLSGRTISISFDKENRKATITDTSGNLLTAHTMYWFAWKTFYPNTDVFGIKN